MPCFSSIPDEDWIAARVRALYSEPFRTMLRETMRAMADHGIPPHPVIMRWQADTAAVEHVPMRQRDDIDWLVEQPRYQRAYSNGNLAATLLCASLWQLVEAGAAVPPGCRSWWARHLDRDRLLDDGGALKPARLPENIDALYAEEKQRFEEIWLEPSA